MIEWPDVPIQAQEFGPLPVFHNTCYGNYHRVDTCTCPRPPIYPLGKVEDKRQ